MNAEETLAALRAGGEADLRDTQTRANVTSLLAGSLRPGDHAPARRLLEAEIDALTAVGAGATRRSTHWSPWSRATPIPRTRC